ncbi:hypothetical protein [Borrelia persica]|uniref:hypothetical protein n=1 Tax=Borrelia persica TaxID=44448 RepID=UPI0004640895|nr:hypothetical protein [Borrelia persica]
MKKICMVVIILGVLFLCCRQKVEGVLPSPLNVNEAEKMAVLNSDRQRVVYNGLKKKATEMRKFYNHRDSGAVSLKAEFTNRFKSDSSFEEKCLYAALGGKAVSIGYLKTILIDMHDTLSDYNKSNIGKALYDALENIVNDYYGSVIDFCYSSDGLLIKLEDVQDIKDLKVRFLDLHNFHLKWVSIVTELQNLIGNIAKLCVQYLEIKDQAGKVDERSKLMVEIENKVKLIIDASKSEICEETNTLCVAISNFSFIRSGIMNFALMKPLSP